MEHEQHQDTTVHTSLAQEHRKNTFVLSGAILLAAIIVGVSILYAGNIFSPLPGSGKQNEDSSTSAQVKDILSIRSDDYVWGSKDAPVKLFEFSDLECPYCKQFHVTLNQVINTYGASGKVAVVYRHFPLSIHPKAFHEAEALECAGKVGGNDAFWRFADRIFSVTPSNNQLDPAELSKAASYIGLPLDAFNSCLTSQQFTDKIQEQQQEGIKLGVQGTPYSFVVTQSGKVFQINGAQDATGVKNILDVALRSN